MTKRDELEFQMTPLGAALVEAMPDKQRMSEIKRRFARHQTCPTSAVFPTSELVRKWYERKENEVTQ